MCYIIIVCTPVVVIYIIHHIMCVYIYTKFTCRGKYRSRGGRKRRRGGCKGGRSRGREGGRGRSSRLGSGHYYV